MLREKYPQEIERILAIYPPDQRRSAVMPLLYLAQRESGYVTRQAMEEVAGLIGLEPTQVGSLVGFYTLYHDEPGGTYRIQVCTDLPCALRGAEAFAEDLCRNLGIRLGETTADGSVTVEAVMCLAGCDRAPLFQLQTADGIHYHENQTVQSALELIEHLRRDGGRG
ncbi:MAG: NADH-quinone oxidoreductase subunit NuoE [Anaerolineales bacterium]|nr:NADH-quinone oxidoreductase subunit NuoE [Anaerolineales bacterium]